MGLWFPFGTWELRSTFLKTSEDVRSDLNVDQIIVMGLNITVKPLLKRENSRKYYWDWNTWNTSIVRCDVPEYHCETAAKDVINLYEDDRNI